MNKHPLPPVFTLHHTPKHVHIALPGPRQVLSSAALNGGWTQAEHIVNMRVQENFKGSRTEFDPPETALADYSCSLGLSGRVVGMMTSARMSSFRQVELRAQQAVVSVLVTAGLSNAKRAGETAEWRSIGEAAPETGTINIILLTNLILTPAAMVEATMVVTEAKTVALTQLNIISPQAGNPPPAPAPTL